MGVFATRSPYRPNDIGLSSVRLRKIVFDDKMGPMLYVEGADLLDGTPIYDIKPYIKYADSHPDALCGYVEGLQEGRLRVILPAALSEKIGDESKISSLVEILQLDPRPSYHNDSDREYGLSFSGYNIRFRVDSNTLEVIGIS